MLHFTNLLGNFNLSTEKLKTHQSDPKLLLRGRTMALQSFELCRGWLMVALGREGAWLGAGATQCHASPNYRE